ncbi:MAG: hypothetical protein K9N46_03100 [Candidatus Marinimicrobia bacterium]|nr:hypothetical protein [Candidatus Neomarinimicrobiota bacterium]MCF7828115.1 hypothetical protein [Candidatus Neomarinimicrobiota bacterium]MCF7879710.1 hypothetical protein [Candidatus Neomarinimicrobiota bacterium]
MDNITELVRSYANFFYRVNREAPPAGERILTLPLSKALGWAKELLPDLHPDEISVNILPEHIREEIIEIMEDSPDQLLMDARYLYLEQFLSQSFFYYFILQASLGHDEDEINRMAEEDFNITGEYKIYKPPQHRNKYASRKTTIFLDWDDTIDTGSIREKFNEFIDHYRTSNYVTTGHSYSLVVTSASISLEEKLKRLDKDLLHGLDAVYTVPACSNWVPNTGKLTEHADYPGFYRHNNFGISEVSRLVTPDMHNAVLGKLYTDVSQQLDVDPEHAIIITDQFADQSADKSIPLVTLVVPRDESVGADIWIRAINFLENKGDFNIYHGANRLTWGLQRPRGNYEFRRYKAADGLELYRTPRFPNCYFLGHAPTFKDGIIRF